MALKQLHRLWSDRSGTVLMEFVIAFPPWLLLILGIMQFSMVAIARLVVLYAAHAGARAALVAGNDSVKMQVAAEKAARQVCALVLQVEEASAGRRTIPGWGALPGSGSVDALVKVPVLVSVGRPLVEPFSEEPELGKPMLMTASLFPWRMYAGSRSRRVFGFKGPSPPPPVAPPVVEPPPPVPTPDPPAVEPVDGGALYIEDKLVLSPPEIWNGEEQLLHVRVEMEFPLIMPLVNALIGHRLNQQRLYWNPFAGGGIWGNSSGGSQGGRISGFDTGTGSYYISLISDVQMVRPFTLADKEE